MATKKGAAKTAAKGRRYSPAHKQKVVDFVNSVNAEKGRGGVAAATKKFGITALTVSKWMKDAAAAGGAVIKPAGKKSRPGARKAARGTRTAGGRAQVLSQLSKIHDEIAAKKADLDALERRFEKLKAAL